MNTTTKKAPPTEDEVMDALTRETVSWTPEPDPANRRKNWGPASRLDVAHRIAVARGWDGTAGWTQPPPGSPRMGRNPGTREKGINLYVSVKAVGDVLEQFRLDGRAHAFYGRHTLISRKYGINPSSVYYLTQEALDVALAELHRLWTQNSESAALGQAREHVLAQHADEVEKEAARILRERLADEPDWAAQLDENPTARPE